MAPKYLGDFFLQNKLDEHLHFPPYPVVICFPMAVVSTSLTVIFSLTEMVLAAANYFHTF
jgi:hypothetical protein